MHLRRPSKGLSRAVSIYGFHFQKKAPESVAPSVDILSSPIYFIHSLFTYVSDYSTILQKRKHFRTHLSCIHYTLLKNLTNCKNCTLKCKKGFQLRKPSIISLFVFSFNFFDVSFSFTNFAPIFKVMFSFSNYYTT